MKSKPKPLKTYGRWSVMEDGTITSECGCEITNDRLTETTWLDFIAAQPLEFSTGFIQAYVEACTICNIKTINLT